MSNLSIVIMAGGKGSRWRGGGNKVLVPINGTPLIARTIHQVASRQPALSITVVTADEKVCAAATDAGADTWWPVPREVWWQCRCIAEAFLAAAVVRRRVVVVGGCRVGLGGDGTGNATC